MVAKKSIDELKSLHVGKQYGFLTVLDVFRNEDICKWMFHCRCKCGTIIDRQLNSVTSGHCNSCGCYQKSKEFADKRKRWCENNIDKIRVNREDVIENLRFKYVGKTFNWLEITDISITFTSNGRIRYYNAHCKCKCGNNIVTRLGYVESGHTKSCGCYNHSEEHNKKLSDHWKNNPEAVKARAAKHSEWCKNNPEKVKDQAQRYSQWCKDHPDKIKGRAEKFKQWCKDNSDIITELGKRHSQYYKDNPDIGKNAGKKISDWYKNNPEKVKEKAEKYSQQCKDNPEICKLIGKKVSEWYKNNPEKVKEKSLKFRRWCANNSSVIKLRNEKLSLYYKRNPRMRKLIGSKISQWCKDHPDKVKRRSEDFSALCKNIRISSDYSALYSIIHPDYRCLLDSGDIKSTSIVKTRCPICGNYDSHTLGNLFVLSSGTLKNGSPPMCVRCRNNYFIVASKYEQEISDYISTFYTGECIRNSRDIISPLELDLYYPEKKIAIEFNGDYWHSEIYKSSEYHKNKYLLCKEKEILLISIFESKWNSNKEEIELYLADTFDNKLNKLSLTDDCKFMSNNYPSRLLITKDVIVEDYYVYNKNMVKVYTCGVSEILEFL